MSAHEGSAAQAVWELGKAEPPAAKPLAGSNSVNHPRHYNVHPSGVECITVAEHMTFNLGNAVKYIWRAGEKGNAVDDLKKSIWYIQREIGRREKAGAP